MVSATVSPPSAAHLAQPLALPRHQLQQPESDPAAPAATAAAAVAAATPASARSHPPTSTLSKLASSLKQHAQDSSDVKPTPTSASLLSPASAATPSSQPPLPPQHHLLHKTRNSSIISFSSINEVRQPSIISKPPPPEPDAAAAAASVAIPGARSSVYDPLDSTPGSAASSYDENILYMTPSASSSSATAKLPTAAPKPNLSAKPAPAASIVPSFGPASTSSTANSSRSSSVVSRSNSIASNNTVLPRITTTTAPSSSSSNGASSSCAILSPSSSGVNLPALADSAIAGSSTNLSKLGAHIIENDDATFAARRKSSVSFTEPKAHAERVRSVNQLHQNIAQHLQHHHHHHHHPHKQARALSSSSSSARNSIAMSPITSPITSCLNVSGSILAPAEPPAAALGSAAAASVASPTISSPAAATPADQSPKPLPAAGRPLSLPAQPSSSYAASVASFRNNSARPLLPEQAHADPLAKFHIKYSDAVSPGAPGNVSPASTSPNLDPIPNNPSATLQPASPKSENNTQSKPVNKLLSNLNNTLAAESPSYWETALRRGSRIALVVPPAASSANGSAANRSQSPGGAPQTKRPVSFVQSPVDSSLNIDTLEAATAGSAVASPSTPTLGAIDSPSTLSPKQVPPKPSHVPPTTAAADDEDVENHRIHILIAVTGSVATIKIPLIISKLRQIYGKYAVVQLIVTSSAQHFLNTVKLPQGIKVWHDSDEWSSRRGAGAELSAQLHVQLRRWADILLIAPLSANTLAKMANGICDNLITSVFRAWNPKTPVVVAPAMNTHMYTNPMTKKHLEILRNDYPYVHVLRPIEKVLVCGDIGMGGMREWTDVVDHLVRHLGGPPTDDDDDDEEEDEEEEEKKKQRRLQKKRQSADLAKLNGAAAGGAGSRNGSVSAASAVGNRDSVVSVKSGTGAGAIGLAGAIEKYPTASSTVAEDEDEDDDDDDDSDSSYSSDGDDDDDDDDDDDNDDDDDDNSELHENAAADDSKSAHAHHHHHHHHHHHEPRAGSTAETAVATPAATKPKLNRSNTAEL